MTTDVAAGDEWVLVGRVASPHGIRGEVKVRPLMEQPESLATLPAVRLRFPDGRDEKRRVTSAKPQPKDMLLVTLGGVGDRDEAEAVRGAEIYIRRDQLPPLGADTYYELDLLGCAVVTEGGADLGTIEKVHFNPAANDVYETAVAMIPAVDPVVVSVDITARRVLVRDIAGLRKDE
jgi:16S rRNA processing protein RimM